MAIPIEDEVVMNNPTGYVRGKVGFNKSNVVMARRLIKAGKSPEEIALAVNVQLPLVQKFVKAELEPKQPKATPVTEPAAEAEGSDDQN